MPGLASILIAGSLHAAQPLIVTQSGSMEARQGAAFAARVTAPGEALEYQWFHNEDPIDGQNGHTLLLSGITQENAGGYQVMVSNANQSFPFLKASKWLPCPD